MIEWLLSNATWLLPLEFGLAVAVVAWLAYAKSKPLRRVNWALVDLFWIASSAVTIYFLATSILYDRTQRSGQVTLDGYRAQIQRGWDQANLNLELWCLGPSRRIPAVQPVELQAFCDANSRAAHLFRQAQVNDANHHAISHFTGAEASPISVAPQTRNQDALILDIRWREVREGMLWVNENVEKLKLLEEKSAWISSARRARVGWLYLFVLLIAARLSRPIWELREPRAEQETPAAAESA